jgi:hypothetical protein
VKPKGIGSHGAAPPGSEAGHHQPGVPDSARDSHDAAYQDDEQTFEDELPADAGRVESDRPQQPDFPRALFDAELEEHPCEEQRRDHQEEAEVSEVLAEVGGAARRRQTVGAHVLH